SAARGAGRSRVAEFGEIRSATRVGADGPYEEGEPLPGHGPTNSFACLNSVDATTPASLPSKRPDPEFWSIRKEFHHALHVPAIRVSLVRIAGSPCHPRHLAGPAAAGRAQGTRGSQSSQVCQ